MAVEMPCSVLREKRRIRANGVMLLSRPYSVSPSHPTNNLINILTVSQANDVSANLHNKVTKGLPSLVLPRPPNPSNTHPAAAAKILKDLHERGEIEGRVAGTYPTLPSPPYLTSVSQANKSSTTPSKYPPSPSPLHPPY